MRSSLIKNGTKDQETGEGHLYTLLSIPVGKRNFQRIF